MGHTKATQLLAKRPLTGIIAAATGACRGRGQVRGYKESGEDPGHYGTRALLR
jgi:hypothetical protein